MYKSWIDEVNDVIYTTECIYKDINLYYERINVNILNTASKINTAIFIADHFQYRVNLPFNVYIYDEFYLTT